jgi:EAL domain-containing protein (putative c-di-GMP-specific phosphodiesterase class I)
MGEGVASALRDAGLEPSDLVLEVSERRADADPELFAASARRVREGGFGLALDDVGTGYATLGTLERVRPDFLKMDVSIVRGIHENLIKQEMLASLVHIARRLGAEVVAEGIETAAETATLRAAGARFGQGYLFARPCTMKEETEA